MLIGSANLFAPNDKLAKFAGTSSGFQKSKLTFKFRFLFSVFSYVKTSFPIRKQYDVSKINRIVISPPNIPIYQ